MRLTSKRVAKLVRAGKPGKFPDAHNLYLQIKNRDNASWLFRYERNGVEHAVGLGPLHTVGLAKARDRAKALRLQLLDGINPLEAKRAAKAERALAAAKSMTVSEAVRGFVEQHSGEWKNPRHAQQWATTIAEYVEPIIGNLPVATIDQTLVLKVLEQSCEARRNIPAGKLWLTRPETARRVRGRLERILDYAKARGYRSGQNPADWSLLSHILPAPKKLVRVEHHPAMAHFAIPAFMAKLRAHKGNGARALEYTILCAARSGETLGATWDEIDLSNKVWTIPASKMKSGREHRVPLSDRAIEILREVPRGEPGNNFVFIGGNRAGRLSHAAMITLLKRLDPSVVVHGFRSSFRDFCGESTAYPSDLAEAALAHIKGKTERAYERGDKFKPRARLMADWSKYCASTPRKAGADVVPIRA
jgi:integrase